jgi:signal transduction histidine kinase
MTLTWLKSSGVAVWLTVGIGMFVLMLAWFGVAATREWQRSSVRLVERRGDEAASLLVTALMGDMRAVETTILSSPTWQEFSFESPVDVTTLVASAFARYPYPDAFFAWEAGSPVSSLVFFFRSGRAPIWSSPVTQPSRYPVRTATNDRIAAMILERLAPSIAQGRPLAVTESDIAGTPYQIVARLHYRDRFRQELAAVYGFTVDLPWIREHYLPEITRQVSRIGGEDAGLALGILDDHKSSVVATRPLIDDQLVSRRSFPLMFFDPASVTVNPPPGLTRRVWTVWASAAADPALAAAVSGGIRTLLLMAFATAMLAGGLALSARAVRANAQLAGLRADFVSSVTHELKTPLASIRALAGALTAGRVPHPEAQREYAALVVHEARRLSRLVDNLLAHARITDVADVYAFEALDVGPLIRRSLGVFEHQLRQDQFVVQVDVPPALPPVLADSSAMALVLDNLIDNAIRYSRDRKELRISADVAGRRVRIHVIDKGIGIPGEDLDRVMQKFVRGRNATASGSGLGLAIVRRIIDDHRGQLTIDSTLDKGTTATVVLRSALGPAAEDGRVYEEPNPGR